MDDLRLLIVIEPGKDGAFVYVNNLVEHLLKQPELYKIDLMYSSIRSGEALNLLVNKVKQAGGDCFDMKISNAPSLRDVAILTRLIAAFTKKRYFAVHAHSSKAGALVRIAAILTGFKNCLYTPHAYYGMKRSGGLAELVFNSIEKVLGKTGITIQCSEDEMEFGIKTLGLDPRRCRVIHNGIDTNLYTPCVAEKKRILRESLGLPTDVKILCMIGRASFQKNCQALYHVIMRERIDQKWVLLHAGDGSENFRRNLPIELQSRVFAINYSDDIVSLLQASDGYIMVSRYEGLSLSMLQALSVGLPMILTKVPGISILQELGFQEIRWLPNPDSEGFSDQLSKEIAIWAQSHFSTHRNQRDLAITFFNEEKQYAKVQRLYSEMLISRT